LLFGLEWSKRHRAIGDRLRDLKERIVAAIHPRFVGERRLAGKRKYECREAATGQVFHRLSPFLCSLATRSGDNRASVSPTSRNSSGNLPRVTSAATTRPAAGAV